MVLVTHDSTVARRAQRIGVMKNGRLRFKPSPAGRPDPPGPPGLPPPDLPGRQELPESLLEEPDLLE
jgi:hypothetical protein